MQPSHVPLTPSMPWLLCLLALLSSPLRSQLVAPGMSYWGGDSLLRGMDAPSSSDRRRAVVRALTLKEALWQELLSVITQAGADEELGPGKADALRLVGELGLVAGLEALDDARAWAPPPLRPWEDGVDEPSDWQELTWGQTPSGYGLARLAATEQVARPLPGASRPLTQYLPVQYALLQLRSRHLARREAGLATILKCYSDICSVARDLLLRDPADDLTSATAPSRHATRVAAAYLLGEFRDPNATRPLLLNIELQDEGGDSKDFPQTVVVGEADQAYPCVVALLKIGRRARVQSMLFHVRFHDLAPESLARVAKVMLRIHGGDAVTACRAEIERLAKIGHPQAQQQLVRLRTFESLIVLPEGDEE